MRIRLVAGLLAMLAGLTAACDARESDEVRRMKARDAMIEVDIRGRGVRDPAVLESVRRVPRHEFVAPEFADLAYADHPLPIGHGQTISQPYMVAAMTALLEPEPGDVVLEVGTGCGYQAAVLSGLVRHVYTIEIVASLGEEAADRLSRLGYTNVTVRVGDGYAGWPEHAPFDGIVVTCGAEEVPSPLVDQLKPGGRMVIPVGPNHQMQELMVISKKSDGSVARTPVMPVLFVPMTGDGAGREKGVGR